MFGLYVVNSIITAGKRKVAKIALERRRSRRRLELSPAQPPRCSSSSSSPPAPRVIKQRPRRGPRRFRPAPFPELQPPAAGGAGRAPREQERAPRGPVSPFNREVEGCCSHYGACQYFEAPALCSFFLTQPTGFLNEVGLNGFI